jgi:hypothetical protein
MTITMIELWLILHTVADVMEWISTLAPQDRMEWEIMFQPE